MSIQPPFGFIPQYYRQAHDYSFDALKQQLDLWKTAGCTGAAVHGVTSELDPATFEKHAREITQRGLLAFAAFGLNSDTPEEKARVARMQQMTPAKIAPVAVYLASDVASLVSAGMVVDTIQEAIGEIFEREENHDS